MSRNAKYVGVAVAGGLVGAALGLLLAPASGQETRRRMARRMAEEKDALVRQGRATLGHVSGYVQDQISEGRRKLARAVNA